MKKRIIIIGISVIFIILVIFLGIVLYKSKTKKIEDSNDVVNEGVKIETSELESTDTINNTTEVVLENTETTQSSNVLEDKKSNVVVSSTKAESNNTYTNNEKATTTTEVQKVNNVQTNTINEKTNTEVVSTNTETKIQESTVEEKIEVGEKYVINYEMINKMKKIIESNPSDTMKQYGFSVIEDSSIIDLTNQFTFTETRVLNKITWRFGVIKIYVRDYYKDGIYINTQCFIL